MDFDLNEDQTLLKGLVERFVHDAYSSDKRQAYRREPQGFSLRNWARLADLGLLGLPFPSTSGGLDGSAAEVFVAFEALGRGLVAEPMLTTLLTAGKLIELGGTPAQQAAWLPRIIEGRTIAALAHSEREARFNLSHVGARATRNGDGYTLTGRKSFVPGAGGADLFVVSARESGAGGDAAGIALFLVFADARGLTRRDYRLADGSVACELDLDEVSVPVEARLPGGFGALQQAVAWTTLGIASELLGLMSLLMETTLEHVRTRRQFRAPIGSFQANQHKLVDLYVAMEQSRSLVLKAVGLAVSDPATWARTLAGAKAYVSDAALKVGEASIQLHGGMGVTDELIVGHAHKRILVLTRLFGDTDHAVRLRNSVKWGRG